MSEDYAVARFYSLLADAFKGFGGDLHVVQKAKSLMEEAGFINVQEKVLKVPIGVWPKVSSIP